MLTTYQKEAILRRAGIAVPAAGTGGQNGQLMQADAECFFEQGVQAGSRPLADAQRSLTIDALFDKYTAHRAAKSLRDDDAARHAGSADRSWGGPTS